VRKNDENERLLKNYLDIACPLAASNEKQITEV